MVDEEYVMACDTCGRRFFDRDAYDEDRGDGYYCQPACELVAIYGATGYPSELTCIEQVQALVMLGLEDWQAYGLINTDRLGDLVILNYTDAAMWRHEWTFLERVARGLIINAKTGEIVARPFDKFFNLGDPLAAPPTGSGIETILTKADGVLGILYRHQGRFKVATRGRLESYYTKIGTALLNRYDLSGLDPSLTLMLEIIHPKTKIQVDYGDRQELILIGARNRHTGRLLTWPETVEIGRSCGFGLPDEFAFASAELAVESANRLAWNEGEGYVIRYRAGDQIYPVKVKGEPYRQVASFRQGLTEKKIATALRDSTFESDMSDMLEGLPDEVQKRTLQMAADILKAVMDRKHEAHRRFLERPTAADRKTFALWVSQQADWLRPLLFMLFDGKDIEPMVFRQLYGL